MPLRRILALAAVMAVVASGGAEAAAVGVTRLVSVNGSGGSGNARSLDPDVGFFDVVFSSEASDLLPPGTDTNGTSDIYTWHLGSTMVRLSVSTAGTQANGPSYRPTVTANGRYVAFESDASNLVAGDTNGRRDVFVRDRDTDGDGILDEPAAVSTSRVSVSASGAQADGDSSDASLPTATGDEERIAIAFTSRATNLVAGDSNGRSDVFVRFFRPGEHDTVRVSITDPGQNTNGDSYQPYITEGISYVAFASEATNLAPGDTNSAPDVFLWDLDTRRLVEGAQPVSQGPAGIADGASVEPSVTWDGRFVSFTSTAANLDFYDAAAALTRDTNGLPDVYIRDVANGATRLASITPDGDAAAGSSRAGEIGYPSFVLRDLGVPDEVAGPAQLALGDVLVAFSSDAPDLVDPLLDGDADTNGVEDVFLRFLSGQVTQRVSLGTAGIQGDGRSFAPALSQSGDHVVFASDATTFEAGDGNAATDVYISERRECARPESGPVSSPVHSAVEPLAQGAKPAVHQQNCTLAAQGL